MLTEIFKTMVLCMYIALLCLFMPYNGICEEQKTWTEPVTGMVFIWVPGGCYLMGCGDWAYNSLVSDDDEKPEHKVCLDGFWLGKYEVTQAQWKKVMRNNPSYFKSGDNYPVEHISWNDAQEFITRLNYFGKQKFRLPTEAEWEYAARSGGKNYKYSGSETNNDDDVYNIAWFIFNSNGKPHEVGTKISNRLGFYDMSGNVSEWCQDVYDAKAYYKHFKKNPLITAGSIYRVFRGGNWDVKNFSVTTIARFANTPDGTSYHQGLRLCLPKLKK